MGYVSIPYRGYVPAVNLPGGVGFQGGSLPRGPPPRWIDAPSNSRLEGVWRVRFPAEGEIRGNVGCGSPVLVIPNLVVDV